MSRSSLTWAALGACVALAFGALAWLSTTTLELERSEAEARRAAAVEEQVRLALWRMDARISTLVAQESSRTPESYAAPSGGVLRRAPPDGVRLHFALDADGVLRSPQVPEGRAPEHAAGVLLAELEARLDRELLWRAAPEPPAPGAPLDERPPTKDAQQIRQAQAQAPTPQGVLHAQQVYAQQRNEAEYNRRATQFENASNLNFNAQDLEPRAQAEAAVAVSAMAPLWTGRDLLLVRRVVQGGGEQELQAVWLDWPVLRRGLLAEVKDLLPAASLEFVPAGAGDLQERRLASLPLSLAPGEVKVADFTAGSSTSRALVAAWAAVLLALLAGGFLLFGALSLSERRAAFVSAVTHELRTPLTTFRMYSEMLAEGMVAEEQRRAYYETLQREANRLARLVDNVLAYARLERHRLPRAADVLAVHELFETQLHRARERAAEAGMALEVQAPAGELRVLVEPSAAEQILFNLVDNACKYARDAEDKRIELRAERRGSRVALLVSDHGEGVAGQDVGRLFEPFSRSAEAAAESAPGVGLGLALSRRLARAMGGELRYEHGPAGATFALLLRAAR